MTVTERIAAAKSKTRRVVDHAHYLLELHENNAIVLYSPTLSQQIPASFAANAFNVFQQGMHQIEIVRLCALWDKADPEKENIPSVIELIDHPDVIEALAKETAAHWHGQGGAISNPPDDPELAQLTAQAIERSNEQFGQEQAQKTRDELHKTIADSRAILTTQKHASIMNLRDKHLAHSLSETRRDGIAMGSDLNTGYFPREDAESRAQGRARGMAAFLKFVGEAVDLSAEEPTTEVPIEGTKRAKSAKAGSRRHH